MNIWKGYNADSGYDVPRHRHFSKLTVLVRTFDGSGEISVKGRKFAVSGGTVLCLPHRDILRHRTLAGNWSFCWFEFDCSGRFPLPFHEKLFLEQSQNERELISRILDSLRTSPSSSGAVSSAAFALLAASWFAQTGARSKHAHERRIEEIISRMHTRLADGWTVEEMAEEAGMSPVLFRQQFRRITNKRPKQFYDELRVNCAREMLLHHVGNVGETAAALGYSSTFHMSAAFKRILQKRPSDFLHPDD